MRGEPPTLPSLCSSVGSRYRVIRDFGVSGADRGRGSDRTANRGWVMLGADGGIFVHNMPMAGSAVAASHCPNDTWHLDCRHALRPGLLGLDRGTGAIYAFGTAGFYGDPKTFFQNVAPDLVITPLTIIRPRAVRVTTSTGRSAASQAHAVRRRGDEPLLRRPVSRGIRGERHPHFNGHPVTIALTNSGKGWWEVWSDGGVFAFGDAKFYGSTGGIHLTREIVGITPTADGKGYWLVASMVEVFAFGDAKFAGSTGGMRLNAPIIGMVRNAAGPATTSARPTVESSGFGGARGSAPSHNTNPTSTARSAAIAAKRTTID